MLQRWVANKKSPQHALVRLNLNNAKLFEKPEFSTWVTYMTRLNPKNPEAAMMSTLMARFSDDALSRTLIAAEKAAVTKEIATKLQVEQLRVWASQGKSADDVFTLFQLNKAGNKLFDNPQFSLWTKYFDGVNKSGKKMSIMSTLSTHYTDDALLQMILAAKKVARTESMATKLQAEQLRFWAGQGKSADDVFNLYQLNTIKANTLDELVDSPEKANPMVAKTLTTCYTNEGLYKMLGAAKNVGSTQKLATDLQKAQIDNWLVAKVPTKEVSAWMGVKGTAHDSVERVAFRKYIDDFNDMYVKRSQ